MRKRKYIRYYLVLFYFCIGICLPAPSFAQIENPNCVDWHSKIDPGKPFAFVNVKNKTESEIFLGIACLLKLEGKKMNSNVGGATRGDVSEIFGATTVEVAALFYISYLFYDNWQHADAPFLIDKNHKRNTDKAVRDAFRAYKKWFTNVKALGLEDARKQKLDPLTGSGVSWY